MADSALPPTRILSFEQQVRENDPNYLQELMRPVIYKFSNGRLFKRDPNTYTD